MEKGFWIRRLANDGEDWKFAEVGSSTVWLTPEAVSKYYKGNHKAANKDAESLIREINRIENGSGFYSIFAAPAMKIGKSNSWKLTGKTRAIMENIADSEDIEAILDDLSEEKIKKALSA